MDEQTGVDVENARLRGRYAGIVSATTWALRDAVAGIEEGQRWRWERCL